MKRRLACGPAGLQTSRVRKDPSFKQVPAIDDDGYESWPSPRDPFVPCRKIGKLNSERSQGRAQVYRLADHLANNSSPSAADLFADSKGMQIPI